MKIVNIVKIENIEKAVLACVLTTRSTSHINQAEGRLDNISYRIMVSHITEIERNLLLLANGTT